MTTVNAALRKRLSLATLVAMLTVLCIAGPMTRRTTAQNGEPNKAELVVRADQPQGTINRNIYGQFAEHLGRGIYDGTRREMWVLFAGPCGVVDSIIEQTDIDAVALRIGQLLDESLIVDDAKSLKNGVPEFRITQSGRTWDLSKLNFEKLKEDFKQATYKNIEIADLRAFIQHKLDQMLQQNATRADFAQRFQEIVDAYNSGSSTTENYYDELVAFTKDLKEESERHIREGLNDDELELFDLLKKEKMTKEETQKVRLAARSLLHRLLEESPKVLVQDWHKDGQTKRQVKSAVEEVLNRHLPDSYDRVLFKQKCDNVFELMVNYASQGLKWAA